MEKYVGCEIGVFIISESLLQGNQFIRFQELKARGKDWWSFICLKA